MISCNLPGEVELIVNFNNRYYLASRGSCWRPALHVYDNGVKTIFRGRLPAKQLTFVREDDKLCLIFDGSRHITIAADKVESKKLPGNLFLCEYLASSTFTFAVTGTASSDEYIIFSLSCFRDRDHLKLVSGFSKNLAEELTKREQAVLIYHKPTKKMTRFAIDGDVRCVAIAEDEMTFGVVAAQKLIIVDLE